MQNVLTQNASAPAGSPAMTDALRLHIGGRECKEGWKILDVLPGPHVDFLGNCKDLSAFADGSVEVVYASHVYEHLDYNSELVAAFAEVHRVLKADGAFYLSVPDLEVLCRLFQRPELDRQARFHVMRMMFGGQTDAYDYHKCGFTLDFLAYFLGQAKFRTLQRVRGFGLFEDASTLAFGDELISLNVVARK